MRTALPFSPPAVGNSDPGRLAVEAGLDLLEQAGGAIERERARGRRPRGRPIANEARGAALAAVGQAVAGVGDHHRQHRSRRRPALGKRDLASTRAPSPAAMSTSETVRVGRRLDQRPLHVGALAGGDHPGRDPDVLGRRPSRYCRRSARTGRWRRPGWCRRGPAASGIRATAGRRPARNRRRAPRRRPRAASSTETSSTSRRSAAARRRQPARRRRRRPARAGRSSARARPVDRGRLLVIGLLIDLVVARGGGARRRRRASASSSAPPAIRPGISRIRLPVSAAVSTGTALDRRGGGGAGGDRRSRRPGRARGVGGATGASATGAGAGAAVRTGAAARGAGGGSRAGSAPRRAWRRTRLGAPAAARHESPARARGVDAWRRHAADRRRRHDHRRRRRRCAGRGRRRRPSRGSCPNTGALKKATDAKSARTAVRSSLRCVVIAGG